jgi:heat shock protein HslJ
MSMRTTHLSLALTVVAALLGALALPAAAEETPALAGSEWRLELCEGEPVPPEAEITASFTEGRVAGKAAVNRYFASYTADGEALTFGEAGSTMMAGPEHLMALETSYLAALKAVRTYRLADGKLELRDGAGEKRLVYGREVAELEIIEPGAPLYLEEGQLWVPVRSLATWMGATVSWEAASRTATAVVGDREFVVDTRRNVARGDGREWTARYRMLRPSGLVYAPLEALAESLGAKVISQPDDHNLIIAIAGRRGVLSAP